MSLNYRGSFQYNETRDFIYIRICTAVLKKRKHPTFHELTNLPRN